jgi:hypothetical protein
VADDEWAPTGIDVTVPSTARVYDFLLDGKDNFASDRVLAEQVIEGFPLAREAAWTNRRFLIRAVRHLAREAGIHQFLDIGTGLPTRQNVHEVAYAERPDSRVVYVDHDPIVLTHARALLAGTNAVIVQEDLRAPERILADPTVREALSFDEPMALLLLAVLQFVGGEDDPYALVRTLVDALPSGSYLAISHAAVDAYPDVSRSTEGAYEQSGSPLYMRTRNDIARFFTDLELVDPGLVWAEQWRPEQPERDIQVFLSGVARVP